MDGAKKDARRGSGVAEVVRAFFALLLLLCVSPASGADGEVAATIRGIVESSEHPNLRWGRFPDYQRHLLALYEPRGYEPFWLRDGRPVSQAKEIVEAFFSAESKGLSSADYDATWLRSEAARLDRGEATPGEIGRFDVALTVSTMRFISDSYIGRVNPRALGFGLDVEPKKLSLPRFLAELVVDPAPAKRLAALDPPLPIFDRLKKALTHMRELAARPDLPVLPEMPTLRPGESAPGVSALRRRLVLFGDLADGGSVPDSPVYGDELVEAVKRFQRGHGLDVDGVVGPATRRQLNVSPRERAVQIELAMERLRWLPNHFADRFLVVNIPEFRLRGYERGSAQPTLSTEVVVGSAARRSETPILHAEMKYVVFRPYWNVPTGIARNEILPKVQRDPGYLARNDMEMVNGRVRQRPGRNNALGLVKFIFPNPHHVYLHDTPSKSLFARSRRDFSHGCIRVANPPALASFVLGDQGWDPARIQQAMQQGRNDRRVDLERPVPVYLFYSTVIVSDEGVVFFLDDIYGHDATLRRVLEKGYPYP